MPEKVYLENGAIAWIKTERELQTEIEQHDEIALLARAVAKILKATDPDKVVIENLAAKHKKSKKDKKIELDKRKKP